MGDNKPESQSPRVPVCSSRREHGGQGSCQHLARKDGARWAAGQTQSSVQQGRASGSLSQGRSAGHGAALWPVALGCLSSSLKTASVIPLRVVHSILLGLLHPCWQVGNLPRSLSVSGPALQTRLFGPQVQISWVCLLATCVCSDLGSFPLEPKCDG